MLTTDRIKELADEAEKTRVMCRDAINGVKTADDAWEQVKDLAKREVYAEFWARMANAATALDTEYTPANEDERWIRLTFIAAQMLLNGPDDKWSGRNNDLARVRHDALTRTVQGVVQA